MQKTKISNFINAKDQCCQVFLAKSVHDFVHAFVLHTAAAEGGKIVPSCRVIRAFQYNMLFVFNGTKVAFCAYAIIPIWDVPVVHIEVPAHRPKSYEGNVVLFMDG